MTAVLEQHFVLEDVAHLFRESPDPFSPDYEVSPALEVVANALYADRSLRSVRLTIALPEDQVTDDVVPSTRAAIARYCDKYLRQVEQTRRGERWRNVGALAVGLLALAIAVLVNRALRDSDSFWSNFFSEGITIAFWVAVWYPLDNLFFGQWQQRLDLRVYRAIRDLDLRIVAGAKGDASHR